jgi:hypothetical protein
MAACTPKGKRKIPKVQVPPENSENAKDIKRRTRHEGDMEEAEAILSQELGGNPVIDYKPMPCPLDSDKLLVYKSLIKRLRGIHHVLKASDLEAVLFKLGAHNALASTAWINLQSWLQTWAKDLAKRIRAMMRHVSQALIKKDPPPWAIYFLASRKTRAKWKFGRKEKRVRSASRRIQAPAREENSKENSSARATAEEAPKVTWREAREGAARALLEYDVGWCTEQRAAWRQVKPKYGPSAPEWTSVLTPAEHDEENCTATWLDGYSKAIPLSTKEWRLMQPPPPMKKKRRKKGEPLHAEEDEFAGEEKADVHDSEDATTSTEAAHSKKKSRRKESKAPVDAEFAAKSPVCTVAEPAKPVAVAAAAKPKRTFLWEDPVKLLKIRPDGYRDGIGKGVYKLLLIEGERKGKQICQCLVSKLGSHEAALKAMMDVATRYVEGSQQKPLRISYPKAIIVRSESQNLHGASEFAAHRNLHDGPAEATHSARAAAAAAAATAAAPAAGTPLPKANVCKLQALSNSISIVVVVCSSSSSSNLLAGYYSTTTATIRIYSDELIHYS